MSARIAGYILILQSEKNHDSVERLNLADRITEVEKANNLYLDLDTQRGIVKEQKGLSATSLHKNCNGLLNQLSYQLVINNRKADAKRKKNERKGLKLLPVINN